MVSRLPKDLGIPDTKLQEFPSEVHVGKMGATTVSQPTQFDALTQKIEHLGQAILSTIQTAATTTVKMQAKLTNLKSLVADYQSQLEILKKSPEAREHAAKIQTKLNDLVFISTRGISSNDYPTLVRLVMDLKETLSGNAQASQKSAVEPPMHPASSRRTEKAKSADDDIPADLPAAPKPPSYKDNIEWTVREMQRLETRAKMKKELVQDIRKNEADLDEVLVKLNNTRGITESTSDWKARMKKALSSGNKEVKALKEERERLIKELKSQREELEMLFLKKSDLEAAKTEMKALDHQRDQLLEEIKNIKESLPKAASEKSPGQVRVAINQLLEKQLKLFLLEAQLTDAASSIMLHASPEKQKFNMIAFAPLHEDKLTSHLKEPIDKMGMILEKHHQDAIDLIKQDHIKKVVNPLEARIRECRNVQSGQELFKQLETSLDKMFTAVSEPDKDKSRHEYINNFKKDHLDKALGKSIESFNKAFKGTNSIGEGRKMIEKHLEDQKEILENAHTMFGAAPAQVDKLVGEAIEKRQNVLLSALSKEYFAKAGKEKLAAKEPTSQEIEAYLKQQDNEYATFLDRFPFLDREAVAKLVQERNLQNRQTIKDDLSNKALKASYTLAQKEIDKLTNKNMRSDKLVDINKYVETAEHALTAIYQRVGLPKEGIQADIEKDRLKLMERLDQKIAKAA